MKQPFAKGIPSSNALSFGHTKGGNKIKFSDNGHVSSSDTAAVAVGNSEVYSQSDRGVKDHHNSHQNTKGGISHHYQQHNDQKDTVNGGGRGRGSMSDKCQRGRGSDGKFFQPHPHHSSHRKDYIISGERNKKPTSFVASKDGGSTMETEIREDGTEVPKKLNNKVFIDGLPYNFDPARHDGKTLEDLLSQYINDWKVGRMMHLTKKPGQGFGYVAFRSPNSADVAVRVLNGRKFLGHPLRVELPKLGVGMRGRLGGDDASEGVGDTYTERRNKMQATAHRQILLSDLNSKSEPEVIREILRNVAPHLEQKIETIKMASNNRKAFLTLESADDVEKAVKFLDGFQLLGRTIAAAQAQAPGSLPYSKVAPVKPSVNSVFSTTGGPVGFGNDVHVANSNVAVDDDDECIPLGVLQRSTNVSEITNKKPTSALTALGPKSNNNTIIASSLSTATSSVIDPSVINNRAITDNNGIKDVYIGNLSEDTTETQLKTHFSHCGFIKNVKIFTNPASSTPTGIACIKFALASAASLAIKNMNGSRLNGNILRVDNGDVVTVEGTTKSKVGSTTSEKIADEIDEDEFLRKRGIKNPKAYFDSVPKVESLEKAAKALAAKKEKAAAAFDAKKNKKRLREEDDAIEVKTSEKGAHRATKTDDGKLTSDNKQSPPKRIEISEKNKNKNKKPDIVISRSNTISFDEDGVEEAKVSASKGGGTGGSDDEEERFVDVEVIKKENSGVKGKKKKQGKI